MILAAIAFAVGGLMMTKMRETNELYAPKGYMMSLQSRPRSAFSY
ncbi:hypothetical protein [Emticicia sp. 21SJ11W-3]|nr:hypothetical protein [Emticicia sp. 21SJ11W-3]